MKINPHRKSQFTLIELLVVIGIIGILSAVLLPAVSSALNNSKKTKAKSECVQIAMAIAAYKADYGKLPVTGTADTTVPFSGDIQKILNGEDINSANPRKKIYYSADNEVKNPWNLDYNVRLDLEYDGKVTAGGDTISASTAVTTDYTWGDISGTVKSWK